MTVVLGIETSCDDTAAAVFANGAVISSVISSQLAQHQPFGGVVPELAGRAHLEDLIPTVAEALDLADIDPHAPAIDAISVTCGPGLIGSLLVGVAAAKALSVAWGTPLVGVNHLEGHLFAPTIEHGEVAYPMVVLLVSGGHTMVISVEAPGRYSLVGQTIDDAAGEAYDKVARFLGLGYPGGPEVDALAQHGNPSAFSFPRSLRDGTANFSFSGLKTSVVRQVRGRPDASIEDICASFQAAVVDILVEKTMLAVRRVGAATVAIGGGVAANGELRLAITEAAGTEGVACLLPSRAMCTDNAAMIAACGAYRYETDGPSGLELAASPSLKLAFTPGTFDL